MAQAVQILEAEGPSEDVAYLLQFIKNSRRGVCFGARAEPEERDELD